MLLTIDSAGQVLSMFTSEDPERGVTEVAVAIGVSKSKAHALLASLTTVGLLRRTERGRYRVGWRVLSLNRVLAETTDFHRHARPVLQTLGHKFGEVVHLGTLDDGKVVYVDRVKGTSAVQIDVSALGSRLNAHCSAVGKVLLASLSPTMLDAVIARHGLPELTQRTITNRAALDEELATVRRRGFAIERGETIAEISCVAAPIVAPGPVVLAGISIAAPSYRFQARKDLYCHAIVRAGRYISKRLTEVEHGVDCLREREHQPVAVPG
jgi:DNA-binding IclR family transcriptional regulator